mmetsp:Transcript_19397/g.26241  ORF Transcript_19397/g.26241 Transcript_19397/m.26241 type:complete len:257 (+) Transcript_19397:2-772(+)
MMNLVKQVTLVNLAAASQMLTPEHATGAAEETRLFTVEVCRHCERQSSKHFPFAKDPAEEFTVKNNCTDVGVTHHHENGRGLRNFFGSYISNDYSVDQVYTQTTYKQRTLDSALSQLEGLYGTPLEWPTFDTSFNLNTIGMKEDFISHLSDDNCPRFTQLKDAVLADPSTQEMLSQVDADLEKTLFGDLRVLTDMPDATTADMHDVCNYIYWMVVNGIEMIFEVTDEQFNQCQVSYQRRVFQKFDATRELTVFNVY